MGLRDDILKQPINNLPARPIILVQPNVTVRDAIGRMIAEGVGSVFVVNDQGKIHGKFSERMLIKLLASGKAFLDEPVGDHAGEFWAVVSQKEAISQVVHKLTEHRMHHLAVVDDSGKPVSMVGQRSLMRYLADHFPRIVQAQLAESKLYVEHREGA